VVTNPPSSEPRPEPTTAPTSPTTVRPRTSADPCLTTQLKITAEQGSGAAGHGTVVIVFVNEGPPCRMAGFPGVAALGAAGSPQVQARRSSTGFYGALATGSITPPTVQMPIIGGVASAILEGLNASPPNGGPCPQYTGLLVTPPGETESRRVPLAFSMCDLKIHPVVPGSDGGTGTSCPDYDFRPQSSDVANNITASATTCQVARSVVAAGPDTTSPNFGKGYAAAGFTCTAGSEFQPPGGGMASWSYNCTDQHGATVTFDRHA
jgi:hypothetical protein